MLNQTTYLVEVSWHSGSLPPLVFVRCDGSDHKVLPGIMVLLEPITSVFGWSWIPQTQITGSSQGNMQGTLWIWVHPGSEIDPGRTCKLHKDRSIPAETWIMTFLLWLGNVTHQVPRLVINIKITFSLIERLFSKAFNHFTYGGMKNQQKNFPLSAAVWSV